MTRNKVRLSVPGVVLSVVFRHSLAAAALLSCAVIAAGQNTPAAVARESSELRYVVYLSRHGVRSPTGKPAQYNQYATAAWPDWPVKPGYLTPHGFQLMQMFGAYDRARLIGIGLLAPAGCADASKITIYADSDQRTRETGKALAQGLLPGCDLAVRSLPEGTNDPMFHALGDASVQRDGDRAEAAVAGRIGGDPANLARAYGAQLQALDHVLSSCGTPRTSPERTSILDVPASLSKGSADHLIDLKGPLNTSATLVENLLLEYSEGMDKAQVGWGCVGYPELESLMDLHTAATDFTQRTQEIAKAQAAGLLRRIAQSIQQAVTSKPVAGAIGRPTDVALFLVGHDTNEENVAGTLNLTWIVDGRRDDTPPGSALVFEVWRDRSTRRTSVRTYFTAQTLEQMRSSTALTASHPPDQVPVFVPGCSGQDMSCDLDAFLGLLQH